MRLGAVVGGLEREGVVVLVAVEDPEVVVLLGGWGVLVQGAVEVVAEVEVEAVVAVVGVVVVSVCLFLCSCCSIEF